MAAGIAIALLGNTLAQFSRAQPSTGGFITFVGKTFGGTSAVTTALLCGVGYIIAMASVIAVSGGFLSITLQRYGHVNIPWGYLTVILTALAVLMMIRGVAISTKIAGFFFAFEMLVLVVVSVASLIKNGGHLSGIPFEPSHITNGFSGLAAGFPLAIYLFIGWENSAALAEETDNPRRNVPRAVFTSVAIMGVSYVLFAYATVSGFGYNVGKLGAAPIPFISVADSTIGVLAFFAYLAGMTSTLGALIAGTNSQARLVFNAGREGLLPRFIGHVNPARRTPMNAIFTFVGISGRSSAAGRCCTSSAGAPARSTRSRSSPSRPPWARSWCWSSTCWPTWPCRSTTASSGRRSSAWSSTRCCRCSARWPSSCRCTTWPSRGSPHRTTGSPTQG